MPSLARVDAAGDNWCADQGIHVGLVHDPFGVWRKDASDIPENLREAGVLTRAMRCSRLIARLSQGLHDTEVSRPAPMPAGGIPHATLVIMVRLTVTLRPPARCVQKLVEAFRYLMLSTRLESGCLGCYAWNEPDSKVHYVEEWATEADMRRRVGSDRFTSVLALLESVQEPPHVQFDFVSATRGLDYVEEVRHRIQ